MKNRKNKILAIAFFFSLILTSGCSISTTRNQYYGFPNQSKSIQQDEASSKQVADTLKNRSNGENR